jgi:glycosyltransferase involved in cell wall biosynthesis
MACRSRHGSGSTDGGARLVTDAERRRPRAVILVGGPANPYSRATRLSRTLVDLGYDVEIAATNEGDPPAEEWDGPIRIRRYGWSGPFGRLRSAYRGGEGPVSPGAGTSSLVTRIVRAIRRSAIGWVFWPHTVRGWWSTLERELPPADLYHACGTLGLPAALAARDRDRRAGRSSRVIHDVIDIVLESNNALGMPPLIAGLLSRRERRWVRAADAHVAVNDPFADRAVALWSLRQRPTVVPNYPEPWTPPDTPPDLIRQELGLASSTRICLFWGRLGPNLGLDEAAEAVLQVPDAAFVLIGFGRGYAASAARDTDPRFVGRHFTLPAKHPDELMPWVASADVAMVTPPPISYNQRHTTPNKFLEAIAAGTPIVLCPDMPTMAAILEREQLGEIAASTAPADIALAIRAILDRPAEERAAWRRRVQSVARERYSWPIAAEAYARLVRTLATPGAG